MRYVFNRFAEMQEEKAYRFYVTESQRLSVQGKYMTNSYYDVIHPKPQDNRTGAEIVADVMKELGLKVVKDDGLI